MRLLPRRSAGRQAGTRTGPTTRLLRISFALVMVALLAWVATRPTVRSLFDTPDTDPRPGAVEATYAAPGRYPTASQTLTAPASTVRYRVFRPADYAMLGFRSPIITWGNGTRANPDQYAELLDHLASYGFTVIAPDQRNTGSGEEMTAAAQYLLGQAGTAGSVFHGRLDVDKVAAAGHSQGSGGAIRAATANPALIDTVVTFSLPSKTWIMANADCPKKSDCAYDPARLTQPAFLVGTHGPFDSVIASTSTERSFYNAIPGRAALGLIQDSGRKKADHNSIQGTSGSRGFLGYVTAWLCAQLRGDTVAATAFDGAHPELVTNANWPGSASR